MKVLNALFKNKFFLLRAYGDSMKPIFRNGDIIKYSRIPYPSIKIDDLILFSQKETYVTHRVIYKTSKYLVTKGDVNSNIDEVVTPHNYIAKAVGIKKGKEIVNINYYYHIQSLRFYREINTLNSHFFKHKIDYVYLKGLPLHLNFASSYPKRIYLDCDILIDPHDFRKVERVLKALGYKKGTSNLFEKVGSRDLKPEVVYYKYIGNIQVLIDIHLEAVFLMTQLNLNHLYPKSAVYELSQELLHSKSYIKINKIKYPILEVNHLLLYLALHFFHHNYNGVSRLSFIAQIIKKTKKSKISWGYIAALCNKYRLGNYLYPSFYLLRKYFKNTVPAFFLEDIKPSQKQYIGNIDNIDIFNKESRLKTGIRRFYYLLILSPSSIWQKIATLYDWSVIKTACFIAYIHWVRFLAVRLRVTK